MEYREVVLRLLVAVIVGGSIGYEREFKNRPAGFRTHVLVCVGAAVVSMIQIYVIQDTKELILEYPILAAALKADIGRMGAQVITGVGFLGAGTIIHEKGLVKGLTTAATIWVVACVGLAIGLGYYFLCITATGTVFISLIILKRIENKWILKSSTIELQIEYSGKRDFIKDVNKYFNTKKIIIKNIINEEENNPKTSTYKLLAPRNLKATKIVQDLGEIEGIRQLSIV